MKPLTDNIMNSSAKRPVYKILLSNIKPKLIIPENVIDEIKFLNHSNESNEWSGVLFYTVEGDLDDVSKMICTAKAVYLMDIGTSGYTSYKFDSTVVDFLDQKSEELGIDAMELYETWKIGHIHSHHNMPPKPSHTDAEEVEDNIKNHKGYLTLIVNNFLKMTALMSTFTVIEVVTLTKSINFKDQEFSKKYIDAEVEGILKHEVDIELGNVVVPINKKFEDRLVELKSKKAAPVSLVVVNSMNHYEKEKDFKNTLQNLDKTSKKPSSFSLLVELLTSTEPTNTKINTRSMVDILGHITKLYKTYDWYITKLRSNFVQKEYDDIEGIELLKAFILILKPLPVTTLQTRVINMFESLIVELERKLANDLMNYR